MELRELARAWCPGSAPMPKLLGLYTLPPASATLRLGPRLVRGFFIVPGMEPASMELAEARAPSGPWF
jgi:hypothetical protein